MTYVVNSHSDVDGRGLYRFDVLKTERKAVKTADGEREQVNLVSAGWSVSIYGDDKRDAIKAFVKQTSPTTRFNITQVKGGIELNTPLMQCVSRVAN